MSAQPLSRRSFLAGTAVAGGGLLIGLSLPTTVRRLLAQEAPAAAKKVVPNAFIRLAPDDTVTILLKHSEMGQGVFTSLPMVVAEELECDWKDVRCEHAPADLGRVFFGAWVTLEGERGEPERYRIVGPDEFDLAPRYISMDSPLGRALLGKRLDEEITVELPSGVRRLAIVLIEYLAAAP